jgi:hypothetical protein
MKEGAVKGDQVPLDQSISGHDVVIDAELKKRVDHIVGVKGQAVAVRDQNKKEVKKKLFLPEGREKPVGDKAVGG